jgi:hypothetical protein
MATPSFSSFPDWAAGPSSIDQKKAKRDHKSGRGDEHDEERGGRGRGRGVGRELESLGTQRTALWSSRNGRKPRRNEWTGDVTIDERRRHSSQEAIARADPIVPSHPDPSDQGWTQTSDEAMATTTHREPSSPPTAQDWTSRMPSATRLEMSMQHGTLHPHRTQLHAITVTAGIGCLD